MNLTRRSLLASATAGVAAFTLPKLAFAAADTIKIGVLHSLSGTMAISETTLKDTVLMLIDAQNAIPTNDFKLCLRFIKNPLK